MSPAEDQRPDEGAAGERQFAIQKIYVKDVSFETPHSPEIFSKEWRPEVSMNLSSEASTIGEGIYDVVLSVTVTVKVGEDTAFLAEVKQAGVFRVGGFSDAELGHMLGSYCPNVLFPFAREAVSDLVTRGGFPQFLMAPVNFDALYAQHLQKRQAEQQAAQAEVPEQTH